MPCADEWHRILASVTFEPQVHEMDMALTEVREEAELLRLRLHIARAEREALYPAEPADAKSALALTPARLSAQVQ